MDIRHGLALFLLTLTFAMPAQARLGETEDALAQRYGKPLVKQHLAWCDKLNYSVNGFSIVVTLLNGVSVGETYRINSGNLTDAQVANLLSVNNQGYSWYETDKRDIPKDIFHPVKQMWTRPNGSTAILTGRSMEFKSIYLIVAEKDATRPPPVPTTAGF